MSKRYIIQSIAYLVCVLSLVTASGGGGVAFAEGQQESGSFLEGQAVSESVGDAHNDTRGDAVISFAVNVYNARYSEISENNRDFTLEFDLSNDGDVQPQVKYIVELQQKSGDKYFVADQRPYDDVTSLAKGQVVHKKITYSIPMTLTGDFRVMVLAANDKGMPYGGASAGLVSVTDHIPGIAVDVNSCFLAIEGEQQKYPLMSGTDIDPHEAIFLQCDKVMNTADFDITFQPRFVTRERTMFGRILSEAEGAPEVIAAGVTKSLRFPLTVQENPQSYQVSLFFADAQGDAITNTISVRYVTHGESATAQNISLDKDRYAYGNTAVVTAFVTGNAHDFPDARFVEHNFADTQQQRLIASVILRDAHGVQCSEFVERDISAQEGVIVLEVPITKDCVDPYAVLTVKNADKIVLDENTFSVQSQAVQTAQSKIFSTQMIYYGVLLATAMVILGIIIYSFVKQRKGRQFSVFFVMCTTMVALLGSGYDVHADSQSVSYHKGHSWANLQMSYSFSKDTYCAGEDIIAGAALSINTCANILALYRVSINGTQVANSSKDMGSDHTSTTQSLANVESNLGQLPIGTHTIPFHFIAQRNRNGEIITFADKEYKKTITVKDCTPPRPSVVVIPPMPSCTLSFSPSSGYAPYSGSVSLSARNHVGTPEVTCTGNLVAGGRNTILLPPGTYNNQNFSTAGSKSCTATVKNAAGVTATCSGSLTVQERPQKPTCSLSFSPSSGSVPYHGAVTLTAQNFTGTPTATCAGTLTPGGSNTIPLLPGRYEQVFNYAGYKDCSVTVRNVIGETATCSGSLTVGTSTPPSTPPTCTPNCSCADRLTTQESCSNGCGGMCYGRLSPAVCGSASGQTFDRPLTYFDDLCRSGKPMRLAPEQGRWAWTCWTGSSGAFCYADSSTPTVFCGTEKDTCVYGTLSKPAILCDVEKNKANADGYEEARKNHMQKVRKECEDRWGRLYAERERCIRAGGHLYTTRDQTKSFSSKNTYVWAEMQKMYGHLAVWKCSLQKNSAYLWQCVGPDSPWHGKNSGAQTWCFAPVGCTGTLPPGAVKCPDAETGATGDMAWQRVDTCVAGQRCAYTNTQDCSGDKRSVCPEDETAMCDGDTTGKTTVAGQGWVRRDTFGECTTDRACECYTKTATDTTEDDKQTDEHGRMIETRP